MIRKVSFTMLKRSKVKSLLLMLLLMATTLFGVIGVELFYCSNKLIKQADKEFTTLGVVEYTGGQYPDETSMDAETVETLKKVDVSKLKNHELVKGFFTKADLLGYLDGVDLSRFQYNLSNESNSIIEFRVSFITDEGDYRCAPHKLHYSRNGSKDLSFILSKEEVEMVGHEKLEKDHIYLAYGSLIMDDFHLLRNTGFREGIISTENIKEFPIVDVTDNPDYIEKSEEGKYWKQIIDYLEIQHSSIHVVATQTMDKMPNVFIGVYRLMEGRYFTDEEAKEGKKVCVLQDNTASSLGVGIGDKVPLKLIQSNDQTDFRGGFTIEEPFIDEAEYEVVGIYNIPQTEEDKIIFIPYNSVKNLNTEQVHYNIANISIKNGRAPEYEKAIRSLLTDGVRISFYDQGYAKTIAPIYAMRINSIFVMVLSFICMLGVILLFATIHISKQRESIAVMTALGTGRKLIMKHLSTGTYILAGIGCLLGGVLGYALSAMISQYIYSNSVKRYGEDLRFSSLTIGIQKIFHENIERSILVPVIVTILIFIIICLITRVYGSRLVKETYCFGGVKSKKKKKKKEEVTGVTTIKSFEWEDREIRVTKDSYSEKRCRKFLMGHSLRAIWKNRNVSRLMIAIPLASAIFMMLFTNLIDDYRVRREEAFRTIPVDGYFATPYGKFANCKDVDKETKMMVLDSPKIKERYCSVSQRYEYIGKLPEDVSDDISKEFDVLSKMISDYEFARAPESKVEMRELTNKQMKANCIVSTEDVNHSLDVLRGQDAHLSLQKEYKDMFKKMDGSVPVQNPDATLDMVVSTRFLEKNGLKVGDHLAIQILEKQISFEGEIIFRGYPIVGIVVGTYTASTGKEVMFTSMSKLAFPWLAYTRYDPFFSLDEVPDKKNDVIFYADTIVFDFKDTQNLSSFREELAQSGMEPVGEIGKVRYSFIINDRELIQTVENLDNNIMLMSLLRYILFGLIVGIGFVSSYLSMRTRQKELAMIRSMGTGKVKTFLMFFYEQSTVTFVGIVIGLILSVLFIRRLSLVMVFLLVVLFACYMLGSALCIMKMNRTNILETLSTEE